MKFTIVTGLSGAGRSSALRRLEDLGYYCVDNLLPQMMPAFASICAKEGLGKVAAAVDMRLGRLFDSVYDILDDLRATDGLELDILFLDASDETLVQRFKEVRRSHPVSGSGEILPGIRVEREKMQEMRKLASHIIDTTGYNVMRLRRVIDTLYAEDGDDRLLISIISFGFKRGLPLDADIVFDMRFLPNPYWDPALRPHSGQDEDVRQYVLSHPAAGEFLDQMTSLVAAVAPHYPDEDKHHLVIAIGCTGGMHRSVTMAEELYRRLKERDLRVHLEHRDLNVERSRKAN